MCFTRGTFLVVFHVNNILFLQACSYLFSALRQVLVHEQNTSIFRSNDQYKQSTNSEKSVPGHIGACSAPCTVALWRCSCARGAAHSLPVRLGMIWEVLAAFCTYQPGTPQVVRLLSQRALVNRVFISRFGRLVCLTE